MEQRWRLIREDIFRELDLSTDMTDSELQALIKVHVDRYSHGNLLTMSERILFEKLIYNSFRKLDVLQELIDDDGINEIMVNGAEHIFYEKEGEIHYWEKGFLSEEKLNDVVQLIAGSSNRQVNEAQPIVDTRLSDGSRVNIVLPPVSLNGPTISIRKFPNNPVTMEKLVDWGTISPEIAEFMGLLVRGRYNIFISGGTGSGKTTFLNALSDFIPDGQRIITIEDSAELQLRGIQNLVRMETRDSNTNGVSAITVRDLIRTALRMRPDRIIVGEIRGAEALDMLQAMNTGHNGSLSTGHSNNATDMLARIETMVIMGAEIPVAAIRSQISYGIDILVHLSKLRDKSRKLTEVYELDGIRDGNIHLNPLFCFKESGEKGGNVVGKWEKTGSLKRIEKIRAEGLEAEFSKFL